MDESDNIQLFQNLSLKNPTTNGIIHYNGIFPSPTDSNTVYIVINASARHSISVTHSMLDNWILKQRISNNANIKVSTHPLPTTQTEKAISGAIGGLFAALYLMIALAFVPIDAVFNIVNDRIKLTKL